jgi:transcriptional regulator with XRE-family HTH domain
MRLFEERVGISPSYIHSIEKENLLPSPERLELLSSVFVEVAAEQEAAVPEEDARRLYRERERSFAVDRLGLDPEVAEIVLALRGLEPAKRTDLIEPLGGSIAFFDTLKAQERRALGRLLEKVFAVVGPLTGTDRRDAILELAAMAEAALEKIAKEGPHAGSTLDESAPGEGGPAGDQTRSPAQSTS